MDWLVLAGLGIIWAALLGPGRRPASPRATVEDFGRSMGMLARTERRVPSRFMVAPAEGARFLGPRGRARARTRLRRRRVLVFLLESTGLSFLVGLAPPLRPVWYATAALATLLGLYVWALWRLAEQERAHAGARRRIAAAAPTPSRPPPAPRFVATGGLPRPTVDGLVSLGDGDLVHVVVRRARPVGVAGG